MTTARKPRSTWQERQDRARLARMQRRAGADPDAEARAVAELTTSVRPPRIDRHILVEVIQDPRRSPLIWLRAMIAWELRNQGMELWQVAMVLNTDGRTLAPLIEAVALVAAQVEADASRGLPELPEDDR
jgi:hypothetical protein